MVVHGHTRVDTEIRDVWFCWDHSVRYWRLVRLVSGSSTEASLEMLVFGVVMVFEVLTEPQPFVLC